VKGGEKFMMLFAGSEVIPSSRLIKILFLDNQILIHYDAGELIDIEGTMYPRLEVKTLKFESADEVNKIKRQFYKACASSQNVFYFC